MYLHGKLTDWNEEEREKKANPTHAVRPGRRLYYYYYHHHHWLVKVGGEEGVKRLINAAKTVYKRPQECESLCKRTNKIRNYTSSDGWSISIIRRAVTAMCICETAQLFCNTRILSVENRTRKYFCQIMFY